MNQLTIEQGVALAHTAEADAFTINRATLMTALKAAGITSATVSYDGGGDSGGVEDVECIPADKTLDTPVAYQAMEWGQTALTARSMPLKEALETFAMEAVYRGHAGWENNEGGRGEVTFDVGEDEITVDHGEHVTETNYTITTY